MPDITAGPGKSGNLFVGTGASADTEVGGVISVDPGDGWKTSKPMYLQDDAPHTQKDYKEWSMQIKCAYDKTDPGQAIMEGNYDSGTGNIMVKVMTDSTNYRQAYGTVTKFNVPVDPTKNNEANITIDSVGDALVAGP
jgi:hypothetical protein